jgi:hypothetical protein
MNPGDIVFSKRLKTGTHKKDAEIEFRGYAFSLLLGIVPPFAKEPPIEHIRRLLASVGFVSFDDVAGFLGEEQMFLCIKKFEEKYATQLIEKPAEPKEPTPLLTVPKLVDLNGKPILPPLDIDCDGQGETH